MSRSHKSKENAKKIDPEANAKEVNSITCEAMQNVWTGITLLLVPIETVLFPSIKDLMEDGSNWRQMSFS